MLSFLGNHWILDLLDIGIVTVIFYKLYMFIRSTRAVSMFLGLLLIIGGGLVAEILGLHANTLRSRMEKLGIHRPRRMRPG